MKYVFEKGGPDGVPINEVPPGTVFVIKTSLSGGPWLRTVKGMTRLSDGTYWTVSETDKSATITYPNSVVTVR